MTWRVPLSDVSLGLEEWAAVARVLDSGQFAMGEITQRFERAFAQYVGARHAIAVSSATAALHLANAALGIGRGDEVIVPSLAFVATANAVRHAGGTPVFADITSEDDFSISPAAIDAAVTPAAKAVTVMHYGGYLCDMAAIGEVARQHGLAVIEDAAHALGSQTAERRKAGTLGDVGCFSFFADKNLVTGEGGMVVTDRDDLAARVRLLRSHGMTTLNWDGQQGHACSYDVVALGYNYCIDEIRSALGLAQLERLSVRNARRRLTTRAYHRRLGGLAGISLPYLGHPGKSAAHLLPILLSEGVDRTLFIEAMKAQGVQTDVHYPAIHRFALYRTQGPQAPLPLTEAVAARQVTLPLYAHMTADEVDVVVEAVVGALKAARS